MKYIASDAGNDGDFRSAVLTFEPIRYRSVNIQNQLLGDQQQPPDRGA